VTEGVAGDALACLIVRAHGLVQGVGFRYACVRQARTLGLAGWVRNRRDGTVEALLQGMPEQVEWMCDWMRGGDDSPARVDRLDVQLGAPPYTHCDGFEQVPTA